MPKARPPQTHPAPTEKTKKKTSRVLKKGKAKKMKTSRKNAKMENMKETLFRTGSVDENSFLQTGHMSGRWYGQDYALPGGSFQCDVWPRATSTDSTHDPTAQAGWKSWYVSAPRATRKTQTDRRQVRAERSPRGVRNTSAAPRQPHVKKVSSFSTNSGTVSLMSNSSGKHYDDNTTTRLMSTVQMVRKPSVHSHATIPRKTDKHSATNELR